MTVSTEVDHNDYLGNGVTTIFPYHFRVFKSADLTVTTIDLNENQAELIQGTDYTVTGAGSYQGGNVVLTSALADNWKISISRELPVTQETDLRNQGKFFPEVHENAFDKLTMLIQQALSRFTLALRKPSSIANYYDALNNYIRNLREPIRPQDAATKNYVDVISDTNLSRTLRVPETINQIPSAQNRANKIPAFDSNGNVIVVLPPSGSASDVLIQLAKKDGESLIGGALYADIRAYDGAGSKITCLGRTNIFDNAYGVFALDVNDVTSQDDGGIILVDVLNRRWKRQFTGAIDIRWYCKFDGATDDSSGLQAAINSGRKIDIPAGKCRYTQALNLTKFAGMSGVGGRFKPEEQLSILWFDSSEQNAISLKATGSTFMARIEEVQFRGNGNNTGTNQFAFATERAYNAAGQITIGIKFERVFFTEFSGGGALLSDQWYNDFEQCYFVKCGPNVLTDFTGGIVFRPGGTTPGWAGSGNLISRCYFASGGYGIYNASSWLLVLQSCIFEYLVTPWWASEGTRNTIDMNCWYEANTNGPVNPRGGFYIPGRGRFKAPVTAFDPTLLAVNLGDGGVDVYREIAEGSSFLKINGQRGTYQVHGHTPVTGDDHLDVGVTTTAYDAAATIYPRRGATLSTHGAYYSIRDQPDAFSDKYLIAEVVTGTERGVGGNGSAQGFIGFRTGRHEWSAPPLASSNVVTRWSVNYQGLFAPYADNAYDIGSAALRVKTIYAATGTIQTSDREFKTDERTISELEKLVGQKLLTLLKSFRYKDAVDEKGDGARIHFGIIAQELEAAFVEEGLDPARYALFCRDEWYEVNGRAVESECVIDGEYIDIRVTLDEEGKIASQEEVRSPAELKTRLSIRYDELTVFMLAAMN